MRQELVVLSVGAFYPTSCFLRPQRYITSVPVPEAREGETHLLPSARTAPPSNPARTLRAYGSTRCRVVRAKSSTVARGDPPGDRRSRS